ncbi:6589_t:CDS:2 [Funneliformis mosseae]|uniref:6589_t:CDS:1 n=1 Tax=Funneliformis mosseae TaxID=27381 RepID=A0A9N9E5U2_FUNMO|nr:6589_t:CDS:2 [Funneliformis mosseae]
MESNSDINDDDENEDKEDEKDEDKEDEKDDFTLRMQELEKFFINLKKESIIHKDAALNVAKKNYNEGS